MAALLQKWTSARASAAARLVTAPPALRSVLKLWLPLLATILAVKAGEHVSGPSLNPGPGPAAAPLVHCCCCCCHALHLRLPNARSLTALPSRPPPALQPSRLHGCSCTLAPSRRQSTSWSTGSHRWLRACLVAGRTWAGSCSWRSTAGGASPRSSMPRPTSLHLLHVSVARLPAAAVGRPCCKPVPTSGVPLLQYIDEAGGERRRRAMSKGEQSGKGGGGQVVSAAGCGGKAAGPTPRRRTAAGPTSQGNRPPPPAAAGWHPGAPRPLLRRCCSSWTSSLPRAPPR